MATLVIVPGSFCPAENYKVQIESLAKHGVQALAIDLPSIGRRPQGAATMTDDAEAIAKVVEPLLDQGKEVVILTHSYGGIPGTQSLQKLSKKARAAQGMTGGVETIVYLTSIILQVGVSNYDLNKEQLEQLVNMDDNYMSLEPNMVAMSTFADLPQDEGLKWAQNMADHSVLSFKEPLTYAGYSDVNVHYILCEKDMIIPPDVQAGMIELIQSASGREPTVYKLNSDHAPIASRPDEVSAIVQKILGN